MDFTITIEMDNAAFEDSPTRELSRILSELSLSLATRRDERWFDDYKILDINGNTVGRVSVS